MQKRGYVPRLKDKYKKEVVPALQKEFNYKNAMQVPALEKTVINMGVGEAVADAKALDSAAEELRLISGQKPLIRRAKRSVAGFKLKKGTPIGCKVTLRGKRMYEFLDKLLNAALPRIRDFRGLSSASFDGQGNYSLGIKEQLVFPEIEYDKVSKVRGMDINIVTTAKTDQEAKAFLKLLGLPLKA